MSDLHDVNAQWRADMATLERLIDAHGLSTVTDSLAQIAYEKAEHLEHTWQDRVSASTWRRDAAKLLKLSTKLELQKGTTNGN